MILSILLSICFSYAPMAASISLRATNKYTIEYGEAALQYPWRNDYILVEPYLETTLEVFDSDRIDDGAKYRYSLIVELLDKRVDDSNKHTAFFLNGPQVLYTFDTAGRYKCTVVKTDDEGGLVDIDEFVLLSKKVKREVRALDAGDRERMFTAMEVVYRTSTVAGKALYGDTFRDVYWFAGVHLELSGNAKCDLLHTGAGFLPGHIALVIMFERSMQSAIPSIAVPYYEYTIDYELYEREGLEAMGESAVFGEDWLGPLTSSSLVVDHGRWAYVNVPLVEHQYNATSSSVVTGVDPSDPNVKHYYGSDNPWKVQNSYHRQRPPYNGASFQYITRYKDQAGTAYEPGYNPTCGTMEALLKEGLSLTAFLTAMPLLPHKPVHDFMSGAYCPYASRVFEAVGLEHSVVEAMVPNLVDVYRAFAFAQWLSCPMDCGTTTTSSSSSSSSSTTSRSSSSSSSNVLSPGGMIDGGGRYGGDILYENYLVAGGEGCLCTCPNITTAIGNGEYEYLYNTVFSQLTNYDLIPFANRTQWVTVLRYICNNLTFATSDAEESGKGVGRIEFTDQHQPVPPTTPLTTCWPGEYKYDNSPLDPIFWLAHWPLERYYAMRSLHGFPEGRNWTSSDTDNCHSAARDDVMPWYDLYEGDTGTAENDKQYYFGTEEKAKAKAKATGTGAGAGAGAGTESRRRLKGKSDHSDLPPGDGSTGGLPYTRTLGELMQLFDPSLADVSPIEYVYDHFLWPHCADEGYPITLIE